jgi:hypothetical protein
MFQILKNKFKKSDVPIDLLIITLLIFCII